MMVMEFREKLVSLCGQKGWDQSVLAKRLRVSSATVNAWWNGESKPSWSAAWKLAQNLGVSLDFLADDRLEQPPRALKLTDGERSLLRLARKMGVENALETLVEAMIAGAKDVTVAPGTIIHGFAADPHDDGADDRRSG